MADNTISEQQKLLAERNKLDKESNQARIEANREFEKATLESNDNFKKMVTKLREVQPETAKIVADFKNAGEDTLKGALISRKLNLAMEAAAELEKKSFEELSVEQQSAIEAMFGGNLEQLRELEGNLNDIKSKIETTEFQIAGLEDGRKLNAEKRAAIDEEITEVSKSLEQSAKEQEKINQAKQELLAMEQIDQRTLKKDAKIAFEQKKMELAGQMESSRLIIEGNKEADALAKEKVDSLNSEKEALKSRDDELVAMIEEDKANLEAYSQQKQDLLVEETNVQEEIKQGLEKAKEEQLSGLTDFSEGIKGLTGFDIMGAFDDGVKMFNNLKKVGEGLGKFVQPMIGGLKTVGRSLMTAATSLYAAIAPFLAGAAAFIGGLLVTAGGMLLAAAPYILAGVAIVGLVLAGMKLYEESEKFKAAVDTVIGYFIDIKDSIFKIFGGFFDFWKGLFTGDFDLMFGGLKDMFGGLWDLIKAPFKAIGDFFKNVFGIDIGKFIKDMAKKMLPDWAVDLIFGSGNEAPEMTEEAAEAGKEAAKESGLYEERGLRKSLVNMDMVATAPTNQLEAILNDDDISDESYEAIQKELDNRKAIIADYQEVSSAMAAGQTNLADGTDASLAMEMLEDEIAMRGGAIDQATIDARPQTPGAGGQETIVQQNNNNSSTNIMNDTNSARDENDRYYSELGVI